MSYNIKYVVRSLPFRFVRRADTLMSFSDFEHLVYFPFDFPLAQTQSKTEMLITKTGAMHGLGGK